MNNYLRVGYVIMELIPQKLNELQKLIHPLLDGVQFFKVICKAGPSGWNLNRDRIEPRVILTKLSVVIVIIMAISFHKN